MKANGFLSYEITLPLLVFVFLAAVKIYWISDVGGPIIFYDETLYRDYAEALFTKGYYADYFYPFLYPFTLAPSFFSAENYYRGMLIINSFISSSIIFPTWFVSRLFLNKRLSFFSILITALLPFNLYFHTLLMSENLYMPLLMTAVYVVLQNNTSRPVFWTVLTGLIIGLLHLTRHMSLAVTPVLLLVWWLKPVSSSDDRIFTFQKMWLFLVVMMTAILTYSPWWLMNRSQEVELLNVVSANFLRPQDLVFSAEQILIYPLLTVLYTVLLAGPSIGFVLSSWLCLQQKFTQIFNRYVFLLFGLWICLVIAVSRHHLHTAFTYNSVNPERFQGRYLIYLSVLFLLLGIISASRISTNRIKISKFAILQGVALLLFGFTYWITISRPVWNISPYFYLSHIAPTGFMHTTMGIVSFLLTGVLIFFSIFLFFWKKKMLVTVSTALLVLFYVWGGYCYVSSPNKINRTKANHIGHLSKQISNSSLKPVRIYIESGIGLKTIPDVHSEFWKINDNDFLFVQAKSDLNELDMKDGIFLSRRQITSDAYVLLDKYSSDNTTFYIYQLPSN